MDSSDTSTLMEPSDTSKLVEPSDTNKPMEPSDKIKAIIDSAIKRYAIEFRFRPYMIGPNGQPTQHLSWQEMRTYAASKGYDIRIKELRPPVYICSIRLFRRGN